MNYKHVKLLAIAGMLAFSCKEKESRFTFINNPTDKRIDITIDGEPFTSYIYPDTIMKPVLYPLRTARGTLITRGWPIDPRPGERIDHPHHVGMWFNYGNVNGLDFWNNSTAIAPEKKNEYGTIRHASINKMEAADNQAELAVTSYWKRPDGTDLLKEDTRYLFRADSNLRSITLITKLTALDSIVNFPDNKEGMLGIRLARELEHPTDEPTKFTDASGNLTEVAKLDNTHVTGKYYSSEGLTGDDVWGTRGKWVNLTGKIGDEPISLVIIDHPKNVGYPTYWHARGYGLFAANPLGQKAMSGGKDSLNYSLAPGKSVTFKYEVLINSGNQLNSDEVNQAAKTFAEE